MTDHIDNPLFRKIARGGGDGWKLAVADLNDLEWIVLRTLLRDGHVEILTTVDGDPRLGCRSMADGLEALLRDGDGLFGPEMIKAQRAREARPAPRARYGTCFAIPHIPDHFEKNVIRRVLAWHRGGRADEEIMGKVIDDCESWTEAGLA